MFGFFTKIKAEVAAVKERLEALEQRILALANHVAGKQAEDSEKTDATQEGK